jgi:hypothetical protein
VIDDRLIVEADEDGDLRLECLRIAAEIMVGGAYAEPFDAVALAGEFYGFVVGESVRSN